MVVPRRGGSSSTRNSISAHNRSQGQSSLINFGTRDDSGVIRAENGSSDEQQQRLIEQRNSTERRSIGVRGRQRWPRWAIPVRNSEREANFGRRSIFSWLIDSGTIPLNERVYYMNMGVTQALCWGRITRNGIVCNCCDEAMGASEFEAHAESKLGDPYRNIFLDSGLNLLRYQMRAWQQQRASTQGWINEVRGRENESDQNDDTCGLCGDGGNLICCDGCPSTFHQSCLGLQTVPQGEWFCPSCICIFCGLRRCNLQLLFSCYQCERKYHQRCRWEEKDTTARIMFCGMNCWNLFQRVQNRIGVKLEIGDGYSWSLIRRLDPLKNESVHRESMRITSYSKLAIVNSVMKECFNSLVDQMSGVNVLQNVIFNCGSNLNRLNFSHFYTAVLEKGDEIISAASIRFNGTKIAEMPFIVTRNAYRGQGMCRRLLNAIESTIQYLGVRYLIIPSVEERIQMWTEFYHFKPIDEALKAELRSFNYLAFPSTTLLQKVPTSGSVERNGMSSMTVELRSMNYLTFPSTTLNVLLSSSMERNRTSSRSNGESDSAVVNDTSQIQNPSSSPSSAMISESEAVGILELQKIENRPEENASLCDELQSNNPRPRPFLFDLNLQPPDEFENEANNMMQ